ncbi:MAG: hypothetical protein RE468_10365 [Acidithiobacillus caldus]|nr:hypothetical protein [Acidithiobacillus caldus]WMT46287.1 MAG: hypothetical protein RE468_10365 [Acidithiobacillus caldus]
MTMDPDILQDYLPEARELLERAQEDTLRLDAYSGPSWAVILNDRGR